MIKLVVMDVDGVLTDGKIFVSSTGEEMKAFSAKDGFFIKEVCHRLGLKFAIISGGKPKAIITRAQTLNIDEIVTECFSKKAEILRLKEKYKLKKEEIAYIGDDWFDWPAMKEAGLKAVPNDGAGELKEKADFICQRNGGDGAVRELLEYILKKDDLYEEAKGYYLND